MKNTIMALLNFLKITPKNVIFPQRKEYSIIVLL